MGRPILYDYFIIHERQNPRKGQPLGENYKIHLYKREEKGYNAPDRDKSQKNPETDRASPAAAPRRCQERGTLLC